MNPVNDRRMKKGSLKDPLGILAGQTLLPLEREIDLPEN